MDPLKAIYTYHGLHQNLFIGDFGTLIITDKDN